MNQIHPGNMSLRCISSGHHFGYWCFNEAQYQKSTRNRSHPWSDEGGWWVDVITNFEAREYVGKVDLPTQQGTWPLLSVFW